MSETEYPVPLAISDETLAKFSPDEQFLLRPMKSVVLNMEVMVKFHRNQQETQVKKNPFVSWTLNKVAVIDRRWLNQYGDAMPISDMDWWRVKIEDETSPGQPLGCFIVRPLWKVERKDLTIFPSPSTWTVEQRGLTVLLYPRIRPWMPWIVPKALRAMVMRKTGGAALIIPLSYPPEGDPQDHYREVPASHPVTETEELSTVVDDPNVRYRNQRS
jgi:hypothetical protein